MQILLLLALTISCFAQSTDYILSLKLSDSDTWERVGEMKVSRQNFQNAQILLKHNKQNILDKKQINEKNYALLQLQHSQDQKVYTAYIDGKQLQLFNQKANYQEIVNLVVSNNELLSFDYALKPIRKNAEIFLQINVKELEVAPTGMMPQFEEKLQEEEEQQKPQGIFGLILQYKWYIIIGFIVIFVSAQADPQKLNEVGEQAQQQAQQQARRRTK